MLPKLVVLCHVEPGTIRNGTILYDFDRTEGVVQSLPRIVEFADHNDLRMGFAMTPQSLAISSVDLAGHDVGVHLHPMDPVLAKDLGDRIRLESDSLGSYTPDGQALLIHAARQAYEATLGRSPRLFVAGRWSEDTVTPDLLVREGFTHDGSALPGFGSPFADWSRLPRLAQPYRPSLNDRQSRGSHPLLYLPVCRGLWGDYMTPERIRDLGTSYFKAALKEAQVGGAEVIHFFLHSPLGLDPQAMAAFGEVLTYARDVLRITPVLPTTLSPSASSRARSFPPAYLARLNWNLVKSLVGRGELGRRIKGMEPEGGDSDHAIPPAAR